MATVSRHPGPLPDDLAGTVDAALAPLLLLSTRAVAEASQRVSASQLQALLAIEASGSLKLMGLADALQVIPSSATRLCDRLVAADLIARTPGQTDRREVVLTLTTPGRRLLRQVRALRRAALAAALEQMTDRDRRSLVKGLSALAAHLDETPTAARSATAHG